VFEIRWMRQTYGRNPVREQMIIQHIN
jgi:hypothetical protein